MDPVGQSFEERLANVFFIYPNNDPYGRKTTYSLCKEARRRDVGDAVKTVEPLIIE